jgi:hypothetical protein
MDNEKILLEISKLPANAKLEVLDFIKFLRVRYRKPKMDKNLRKLKLSEEPFIGIWKERKDMKNSLSFVRKIRIEEWNNTNG